MGLVAVAPFFAMVGILFVSAVLTLAGIDYGLPYPLASDEEILIGSTLRMARTMSFVPSLDSGLAAQLYYPVGLPYTYLALFAPVAGLIWLTADLPTLANLPVVLLQNVDAFFLTARIASAAFAIGSVWIIYRLGGAMFLSPWAGVAAAALLATSWFHVTLGHFARHWSATVFFVWLTIWLAWRYYEQPGSRRAMLCALSAVAGFAVGYIAILGYAAFGFAHLVRFRTRMFNRYLFSGVGVLVLGVVLSAAMHWPAITRLIGGDAPVLPIVEAKTVSGFIETFVFYLGALRYAEPALLISGAVGAVVAALRFPWMTLVLVSGFFGYILFLDLFMPLEDRYILPAIPVLALLAGSGLAALLRARYSAIPARVLAVLLAMGVAYAAWNASTVARLLIADDSRELAVRWVSNNVPPGAVVVVAMNPVKLPTSVAGLEAQAALETGSLDFADRFALAHVDVHTGREGIAAIHLNRFPPERLSGAASAALFSALRDRGARYFVFARRHDLARTELHEIVARMGVPVAVFDSATGGIKPPDLRTTILVQDAMVHTYSILERLGPRVEIYDLGPVP